MDIGLCMIVKNEAARIRRCLAGIKDLFADIVIVDTGSSDTTIEILRDELGIPVIACPRRIDANFTLADARNLALSRVKAPWVLNLDADEQVSRAALEKLVRSADPKEIAGFFCAWNTHENGHVIDDYKLCLFREGIRQHGLIHENAQYDFRRRGLEADWLEGLTIEHHPDPQRAGHKTKHYLLALRAAIGQDPGWLRYHWFLGYMLFRGDRHEEASRHLCEAAGAQSPSFPVECLNSAMVLAHIRAMTGDRCGSDSVLGAALRFHGNVADDFEVKVNFRLRPWIETALNHCRNGELERISSYPFAY
jgi:glycosyltransferase involved in cell wall biosynthesis